jgi:hypothetical protein
MSMGDDELMSIRADTLFVSDPRGRIVQTNEVDGEPAPRLFLGQTQGGYVMRAGIALPDALSHVLAYLLEGLPSEDDLTIPAAVRAAVREVLARHAPIAAEGGGPAYCFQGSLAARNEVIEITPADSDVLRETFPGVHRYLASS